jgi:hypothetical protein
LSHALLANTRNNWLLKCNFCQIVKNVTVFVVIIKNCYHDWLWIRIEIHNLRDLCGLLVMVPEVTVAARAQLNLTMVSARTKKILELRLLFGTPFEEGSARLRGGVKMEHVKLFWSKPNIPPAIETGMLRVYR